MASMSGDYGRRTLGFVEKLQGLKRYDDIRRLIVSELEWYGLTRVSNGPVPRPAEGSQEEAALHTRPLDDIGHDVSRRYFGLGADTGFIVPVISRSGAATIFSPRSRDPGLSPGARSALEILGTYAHCALQRALAQERRQPRERIHSLTAREREIIRWVAAGKTDEEIGEVLKISRETVTTHVENAKIKLNAARRTYAIVQALRFGEITL